MSDMNETAREVLRTEVFVTRAKMREAWFELKISERDVETLRGRFRELRNRVAELQSAAGDPIEIDPTYPEIT